MQWPQKRYFFSDQATKKGGGGKGLDTKKKDHSLGTRKKSKNSVTTKLEVGGV